MFWLDYINFPLFSDNLQINSFSCLTDSMVLDTKSFSSGICSVVFTVIPLSEDIVINNLACNLTSNIYADNVNIFTLACSVDDLDLTYRDIFVNAFNCFTTTLQYLPTDIVNIVCNTTNTVLDIPNIVLNTFTCIRNNLLMEDQYVNENTFECSRNVITLQRKIFDSLTFTCFTSRISFITPVQVDWRGDDEL